MKNNFFNIYYINLSKVYELAMMKNNKIVNSLKRETIDGKEYKDSIDSKISAGYSDLIGASINENEVLKKYQSKKIVESLEIKTTKSILLRRIIDCCIETNKDKTNYGNGDLVYIDNIELSLLNEETIRAAKILRNDAIKGMTYEGLDLNNLANSILKDYFYLLSGEGSNNENILFKIPISNGEDFENSYSIDDLLIGKVSIIGIYRGKVKPKQIKSTFSSFSNFDNNNNNDDNSFSYETSDNLSEKSNYIDTINEIDDEFSFIDIIAVIQKVNTKTEEKVELPIKHKCFFKKIIDKIRGKRC